MKKALLILRHEIYSLISRKSFWLALLGLPLAGFLVYGGAAYLNRQSGSGQPGSSDGVRELFTPEESSAPQGFVDLAGIVRIFPEDFPHERWLAYPDETAALRALETEEIRAYYVIEADYLESGNLTLYSTDFSQAFNGEGYGWLEDLLDYNLLGGDSALIDVIRKPILKVEEQNILPQTRPVRDRLSPTSIFVPYGMMSLLIVSILGSSSLMLNSIAKEKENRIMEVLMLSASPHQMLLGKMAGLGLVGLLQVTVWGISAMALLRLGGQTFGLPENFQIEPVVLFWTVIFFLLSYLLNGMMMAGVGALVPNLREASQATMILLLPLFAPYFLISVLLATPNGALSVFLSLFPFTAPLAMVMRLTVTDVPLWQPLLSAALLGGTALLMIRIVAGMFRAQTILSGQKFNLRRLVQALLGNV